MSVGASAYLRIEAVGVFLHWCPGCARPHRLNVSRTDHPGGLRWYFNGNYVRPSFAPAVSLEDGAQRCNYTLEHGWLRFTEDCTHALAGQGVPLPVFPQPRPIVP